MTCKWHNIGIALAILAGLTTIAFATWPIIPLQSRGDVGAVWSVIAWVIGAAFIASAFLTDRSTVLSKVILFAGAAILIASTIFFGSSFTLRGFDVEKVLPDVLPAALGIVAGILIGPIERSEAEIRAEQGSTRLPKQPVPPEEQVPFKNDRAA